MHGFASGLWLLLCLCHSLLPARSMYAYVISFPVTAVFTVSSSLHSSFSSYHCSHLSQPCRCNQKLFGASFVQYLMGYCCPRRNFGWSWHVANNSALSCNAKLLNICFCQGTRLQRKVFPSKDHKFKVIHIESMLLLQWVWMLQPLLLQKKIITVQLQNKIELMSY